MELFICEDDAENDNFPLQSIHSFSSIVFAHDKYAHT